MDEDDEDEDMDDGGDDSFGEDDDMIGVSDVTNQLAAAGWQHGVKFCFVNTLLLPQPTHCVATSQCFQAFPCNWWQPSIAILDSLKSSQTSRICLVQSFSQPLSCVKFQFLDAVVSLAPTWPVYITAINRNYNRHDPGS